MRSSNLILATALAGALVSLGGCAGKIKYPNYYVLNLPAPVPAASLSTPILGSVSVREFEAPGFLREGEIVYRESPEQLGFYAYHRWAEDPRRAVTSAVIQEMQSRGLFQSVDRLDGHGRPDCLVTGTIHHLEEVDEGSNVSIEVSLSAQLVDLRTGQVLWQDTSSKTAKVDQRSVAGLIAEMSRDLENAVESLVTSMQDHLNRQLKANN